MRFLGCFLGESRVGRVSMWVSLNVCNLCQSFLQEVLVSFLPFTLSSCMLSTSQIVSAGKVLEKLRSYEGNR